MLLRPEYLSQKLDRPLPTKDGGTLTTIREACDYMTGMDKKRALRSQWQRVAKQPLPVEVVAGVSIAVGGIIAQAPVKRKRLIKLVDLPTGVVDGRLLGQRQR
jgi:hypothetical protein